MKIIPCDENDVTLQNIIKMLKVMEFGLYLDYAGKIIIGDEVKYLLIEKNIFFVVNVFENLFSSVDIFTISDQGKINLMINHDSNLVLKGERVYKFDNKYLEEDYEIDDETNDLRVAFEYYEDDDEYPIINSLSAFEVPPIQLKYSFYNAILVYIQNNLDTMVMLQTSSFYNGKFDGTDLVNDGYFKEPYFIKLVALTKGFSTIDTKSFYLTRWEKGAELYNLALLKIVGLFGYLFKSFRNSFEFYFSKQIIGSDDRVILRNLLTSNVFDMDDIDKKLAIRGLSKDVPQELIDLFNRDNEDYKFCQNILEEYNGLDNDHKLKLKYKSGVNND